jgi:hypothetical protein
MTPSIQVVFDCADPQRLACFWAEMLGYKLQDPPPGYASWEAWLREYHVPEDQWNAASAIIDPDGTRPRIFFQRVPEPKTIKNRVHLDVNAGGGHETPPDQRRRKVDAEVERLVALGATKLRVVEERGEYWVVMSDLEGNEFCLQ